MAEDAAQPKRTYSSHDTHQTEVPVASRTSKNVLRSTKPKHELPRDNLHTVSRNKLNVTSSANATRSWTRSAPNSVARRGNIKDAPSILPHYVDTPLKARPDTLASSRPQTSSSVPPNGSRIPIPSASSNESPLGVDGTRKLLRRKAPSVEQYVSKMDRLQSHSKNYPGSRGDRRANQSSKSLPEDYGTTNVDDFLSAAPSEPIFPTMIPKKHPGQLPPALIPELQALAAATASNRAAFSTPPVPSVSSPSTQYSGSTGPWSSRDTTPTSISSCSPGIVQPSRVKKTLRLQKSAASTYTTKEKSSFGFKTPPPLDEDLSPSGIDNPLKSNNDQRVLLQQYQEKQRRKPLTSPAPTPPPRRSSVKSKSSQRSRKGTDRPKEGPVLESIAKAKGTSAPSEEQVPDNVISADDPWNGEIPRRPSRKGTVDLEINSSPIVQSNLSPQSLEGYRPRDSLDAATFAQSAHNRSLGRVANTDSQSVRLPRAEKLRRPLTQEEAKSTANSSQLPVITRSLDPTKRVLAAKDNSDQGAREPGRSALGKLSSRLGIFGRRSKVSREDASPQENRDIRKGPAAGTGHEGYGKYAKRGRKHSVGSGDSRRDQSGSTNSRPSPGRKYSTGSADGSDIDDFIAQRLQPVFIPGGGSHDTRPESDAPTIWPSFNRTPLGSETSLDLSRQVTSEPPGSVASDSRSMSAFSVVTDAPSSVATDLGPMLFSHAFPSQEYPPRAPSSFDGYSTSQSSLIQDDVPAVLAGRNLDRRTARDLKKENKTGRLFKWNLFRRKPGDEESAKHVQRCGPENMSMSVAVAPVPVQKPVPYYALMDSENENDGEDVLQDLLEQVYESSTSLADPTSDPRGLGLRQKYGQSVLLPSMPALRQEDSQRARLSTPRYIEGDDTASTGFADSFSPASTEDKPRRLPQVGRIPRVISRRDRQHKPAATSFSRPFQRDDLNPLPKRPNISAASAAEIKRPILGIQTDVLPSRPFSSPASGQAASAPVGLLDTRPLGDFESHPEFLVIPGRAESGIDAASSSDSVFSLANLDATTAHRHHTEEDEIWNEYDDLLDHVMSPTGRGAAQLARPSASQSTSHLPYPQSGEARPKSRLRLGTLHAGGHNASTDPSSSLRLPPMSSSMGASAEYRLRRSRIVSALQSSSPLSPLSPFSTSDYALGDVDHKFSGTESGQHFDGFNSVVGGLASPSAHGPSSTFRKLPGVSHHQSTALLDIAERDREGPAGQSDLRFAALMTSRWLSFGRVLFSPAHDIIEANPEQQILVIDGLGNDDWAFYCAVTYPGAVIHDLKETDVPLGNRREPPPEAWRAPPNYRRTELPNLAERFPFPESRFAVVVFRFPAAMPDTILKMALSECKRVLVPGGHLELSLLDLDVVNMGSITRHAVRNLKARMLGADPEVGLKPIGDNIQNILGQKGFENLNRCVVGVPVAGKVATSSGSRSSRSSRDSYSQKGKEADQASGRRSTSQGRITNRSDGKQERGGNFSLSELVTDHSATSDEKITKMVAKVGRWWFTRTFEWAVLPGGDLKKSIWGDKRVLHECKVRGSGFKLLIAYAQKPMEMRRRTLSEPPARTTDAVSGTPNRRHFDETYGSKRTR